jgi:2-keto-3-deoxy-L-fuconate dehydrogenase
VITGGASGIGRAISGTFAKHGASVHIVDLNAEEAEAAARAIGQEGGTARAYACDVSDADSVHRTFATILQHGRINVLVNNAGVAHVGKIENTTEQDFERIFRVNVKSVYYCIRACLEYMKQDGGGVILNLASIAATAGIADRFAYSMSKGAVRAMTFSVAKDYLPHKIRCNCISPARVHTPFVDNFVRKNYPGREEEMYRVLAAAQPVGRMADPQEVAVLALYLCSDDAAFVTGADYPIDGGFLNIR